MNTLKKVKKDKIIEQNTEKIKNKIENLRESDLDEYVKNNLSNYISDALRLTDYYGNLRIKYQTFNFTFIAFFASILAIYITLLANFNSSLWYIGLPIIGGLVSYFTYFIILLIKKYDTISFKHSDLLHYSGIIFTKDYPKITDEHLNNFMKLIEKKEENNSIKNDLKTLILQYIYQVNYQRVGKKMRTCLIIGSIVFILSICLSFILLFLSVS